MIKDLAKGWHCSESTIKGYLTKFQIKKRNANVKLQDEKCLYKNYDFLYKEHIELGKSIQQIANENGVSDDNYQISIN